MPPKKKSRISNTASPAPPSSLAKTPTAPEEQSAARPRPAAQRASDADIVNDPWTDDEEIGLFKGLIKWKPTGIHKHFQILALRAHLLSNGYIHPSAPHTRIPGIWAKLSTLYDLDALDERENAHLYASEEASEDEADELAQDSNRDSTSDLENDEDGSSTSKKSTPAFVSAFELPDEEFGDLMWKARFPATEGGGEAEGKHHQPSSPPELPNLLPRPTSPPIRFTPSISVAPSSPSTPSRRGRGGARGTSTRGRGRGRAAAAVAAGPRRSSRVADSVATETDEEESSEEEEDDEDEEGEEEESTTPSEGTPAPGGRARAARARGAARGARGKRGRGRR